MIQNSHHYFLIDGGIIKHKDKRYVATDTIPKDGDFVLTENYGIWEFKLSPCPLPYWGNPNNCKPLLEVNV